MDYGTKTNFNSALLIEDSPLKLMQQEIENTRHNFLEILKQQQGMLFYYRKENGQFIHTFCEGKLLHRMGITPEMVVEKSLHDIFPTDYADRKVGYYHRAWEGEENVTYIGKINEIDYAACLSPIRQNGKVVSVLAICIEITEQKRLEEELKKRNIKYEIISDSLHDLVGLLSVDSEILYHSTSFKKILGYSPEKLIGHPIFEFIHPDDLALAKEHYHLMMETKEPSLIELRYRHVNGRWIYIEEKISPVFNENGNIEGFISVGRDITQKKRTEELLRRNEKLSIVGQLAQSIAHEIRNPLTSIKGFVQLLKNEVKNPLIIDTALEEIFKIEEVIQEFLDFAQPQISKMEKINVKLLVNQVLTLVSTHSKQQNITIVQNYDQSQLDLYCDENQMKHVLLQLLQNAIEAMPNGGNIKIQVCKYKENNIKIKIIDSGFGISEERLKKIGEPFYCYKEKGTGLGLMISHKIVQEHGGNIEIRSKVNKGTSVSVILPIK